MRKVERALISVSDKTGIVEFAKELIKLNVEILSTGGTKKILEENGIAVKSVSDYTGFPEMLDGRVKTLHPKIHGGLLAKRDDEKHARQLQDNAIGLIDLVIVNLYPFKEVTRKKDVVIEEAIENIDIGGPSMLRSAAKNFKDVTVVTSPRWYPKIIEELQNNKGVISGGTKKELAVEVFAVTADYDAAIAAYLKENLIGAGKPEKELCLPQKLVLKFEKIQDLRYGENPHQKAAFYKDADAKDAGLTDMRQIQGKELSFNNIMDLEAAFSIAAEFKEPAAAVIKHNNPCGAATAVSLSEAYSKALECDPISAFGSIVGFNRKVDVVTALAILEAGFLECVIAPDFDAETLELFSKKKNVRLLTCALPTTGGELEIDLKKVRGGVLVQSRDQIELGELKIVTKTAPTKEQLASLIFGWKIVKFVKSNAIVICKDTATVGIGAGQMSRVDSVIIAKRKAGDKAKGGCLASDAFFPKSDGIEEAARAGIKAIIQPGGSISDAEVIKTADKLGIAMVFTGIRHFRH
ncbi:MAG: bifunctional phosphoribosylaminoimidazolecarboxamide formyltransferase/IMP cyclohydrolase [Candidatus Omnitrophota bacterium]